MYDRDFPKRAINAWRGATGVMPIDGAAVQVCLNAMTANRDSSVGLAIDTANWVDELRASALGG